MATITLAQAEAQLAVWLEANTKVASGKEYLMDGGGGRRSLKLEDSAEILKQINFWEARVRSLTNAAAGKQGILLARFD